MMFASLVVLVCFFLVGTTASSSHNTGALHFNVDSLNFNENDGLSFSLQIGSKTVQHGLSLRYLSQKYNFDNNNAMIPPSKLSVSITFS